MPARPMHDLEIVQHASDLQRKVARWRQAGETIALVPTMGALHAGHLSLVAEARARARRVVVSVFVNPTQFAPGGDLAAYPRDFGNDAAKLRDADVDVAFHPPVEELYPEGFATVIEVGGPARVGLEDQFHPTHFSGVATIVAKLLILVLPDVAIFGEKDYQQLAVVRRLVRDLGLAVEIAAGAIYRDADGLAMSSRNAYLSSAERARAPILNRILLATANRIASGELEEDALDSARAQIRAGGFSLDYLELRDAHALTETADRTRDRRLLVAARLGRTRLIDNCPVRPLVAEEPGR